MRLAARTLGLVPTVQPIIASMYAQEPSLTGNATPGFELEEERESSVDGRYSSHPARPQISQGDQVSLNGCDQSGRHDKSVPYVGTINRGDTINRLPAPSLPGTGPVSVSRDEVKPSQILTNEGDTVSWPAIDATQRTIRDISTSNKLDTTASPIEQKQGLGPQPLPLPVTPTQKPGTARDVLKSRLEGRLSTESPMMKARQAVTHPQIVTRLEQRELVLENQRESASGGAINLAPTIQVTIGRIEVRATPPPTQRTQPRRSEQPVMSLDEYLNERDKSGAAINRAPTGGGR